MNKTILTIAVAILIGFSAQAQLKGVDYNAKAGQTIEQMESEAWFNISGSLVMGFKHTPVGYKHAVKKINELLVLNDLDFNAPDSNENLLTSYIEGLHDYESVNTSARLGKSEIRMLWFTENNEVIAFAVNDRMTSIIVKILNN